MSCWVRFHEEITLGSKRGIKRALRFVYMELSLAARKSKVRGKILLPKGMSDLDAVHDVIGGDRREIAAALKEFMSGEEPSLSFETLGTTDRYLVVTNWHRWNPNSDISTPRVEKHRAAHGQSVCVEESPALAAECNGAPDVTPSVSETGDHQDRNGGGAVPRAHARASNSPSLSSGSLSTGSTLQRSRQEPPPSAPLTPRLPSGLTPPPDDIELTQELKDACVMNGWPEPTKDHVRAFLLNAKSKAQTFADWNARFMWWMGEERKRMGRRPFPSETGSRGAQNAPRRAPAVLPELK